MNKIYKVIWNKTLGRYVVASEIAKNHSRDKRKSIVSKIAAAGAAALCTVALATGTLMSVSASFIWVNDGSSPLQLASEHDPTHKNTGDIFWDNSTQKYLTWQQAKEKWSGAYDTRAAPHFWLQVKGENGVKVSLKPANGGTVSDPSAGDNVTNAQQILTISGTGTPYVGIDKNGEEVKASPSQIDSNQLKYIQENLDNTTIVPNKTAMQNFLNGSVTNETGDGAIGRNSIAIGRGTAAFSENDLAIGTGALAYGTNITQSSSGSYNVKYTPSTAIGLSSRAELGTSIGANTSSLRGTAIGNGSVSTNGIAIGGIDGASGQYGIAIGNSAYSGGGVAVGDQSNAPSGVSIGKNSKSSNDGVSIGEGAAEDISYMAVDHDSTVNIGKAAGSGITEDAGAWTTGSGTRVKDQGGNVNIGQEAGSERGSSYAATDGASEDDIGKNVFIGNSAGFQSNTDHVVALGDHAAEQSQGHRNVALGTNTGALVNGNDNVFIGDGVNKGTGSTSTALESSNSVVLGSQSTVQGSNNVSLGYNNQYGDKNTHDTVALGSGITKVNNNDVVLGSGSASSGTGAVTTSSFSVGGQTFKGLAGSDASEVTGSVSIGNSEGTTKQYRTLTNLAAGRVSADSVDAVNGSQLYSLGAGLANRMTDITVGGTAIPDDGSLVKGGNGLSVSKTVDATTKKATYDFKLADYIGVDNHGTEVTADPNRLDESALNSLKSKINNPLFVPNKEGMQNFLDGKVTNEYGEGAVGKHAIAVGHGAAALLSNDVAIGTGALALGNTYSVGNDKSGAVALGNNSMALNSGTAIGYGSTTNGGIAISGGTFGASAEASGIAIGSRSNASNIGIAIGNSSKVTGGANGGIAIGETALSNSITGRSIAIGKHAEAYDGNTNRWQDGSVISIGAYAGGGLGSTNLLTGALAKGDGDIQIGGMAGYNRASSYTASDSHTDDDLGKNVFVGTQAGSQSNTDHVIALGYNAASQSLGHGNVDLGTNTGMGVKGNNNVFIGEEVNHGTTSATGSNEPSTASLQSSNSVILGSKSTVQGTNNVSLGYNNQYGNENTHDTVALGSGITKVNNNDVVLGSGSASSGTGPVATTYFTAGGRTFSNFAGSDASEVVGSVSIGNSEGTTKQYRTLTNLAAGRVSATSTDAINGSQLYSVAQSLSDSLDRGKTEVTLGGQTLTTTGTVNNNGLIGKKSVDGIGKATYDITLSNNVTLGSKTEDGSIVVNGADGKHSASLNGADGTLGLTNNDVSTNVGVASGSAVLGGTAANRLTYTDGTGTAAKTRQLATTEDGLIFAGDSGKAVQSQLNSTLNITGGVTDSSKLTSGSNIGVVADGTDGLKVQLAKNLNLGSDGSVTIDKSKMTDQGFYAGSNTLTHDGLRVGTFKVDVFGVNAGNMNINNVANGTVSETSKQAVNGSQLYQVQKEAQNHPELTVGGQDLSSGSVNNNGLIGTKTVNTATQKVTYDVTLSDNVTLGSNKADGSLVVQNKDGSKSISLNGTDGSLTAGNTTVDNTGVTVGTNTTLNANGLTAGANSLTKDALNVGSVTINNNGINAGNQKITGVANGTDNNDAVNVSQLNKVQGDITNITNKIGTEAKGVVKYDRNAAGDDFNLNQITLAGGTNGTKITNVAAGDVSAASTDAINGSQLYKVKNDLSDATKNSMTEVTVGGQTLSATSAGKNGLVGTKNVDANGKATYDVTLSDNVTLGSANADGSITVNSKDGSKSASLNGVDGTLGLTNGSVTTKVGITSGAAVLDGTTANRLTYTEGTGTATKIRQVATTDDGLTFAGDTGTAVQSKLNSKLNITGGETNTDNLAAGNNVGIVANGIDGLKVQLAKDINLGSNGSVTIGNSKMTDQGFYAGKGSSLTSEALRVQSVRIDSFGINAGFQSVKNVAPGIISETSFDAVNGSQLYEVQREAENHAQITINGQDLSSGSVNNNGLIGTKTVNKGANKTTYDITLSDNVSLGSANNDGSITVNSKDGKNSAALNGKDGTLNLKNGTVSTKVSIASGSTVLDGTDANRLTYTDGTGVTAKIRQVATTDDGMTFAGDTGTTVQSKLNSKLNITGGETNSDNLADGNNVGVVANGTDGLKVQLAKNINLTKDGSVTTGDTVVNNNGVTVGTNIKLDANGLIAGNNSLTKDALTVGSVIVNNNGINAGGQKITNVAAGTVSDTSTDAVNGSQLNKVQGDVNNVSNEVNNITNKIGTDAKGVVRYDRDKSGTDFNLGQITLEGTNGTKITNVAAGDVSKDSTDAINGSQLYKVQGDINKAVQAGTTEVTVGGQDLSSGSVNNNGLIGTKTKGADGQAVYDITLSDNVTLGSTKADGSLVVKNKDGSKAVTLNGADGSLVAGNTTVDNNGVTVGTNTTLNANGLTAGSNKLTNTGLEILTTGGTSVIINTNGINAGGQKITNVADGTISSTSTDAVNGSQMNKVQGDVNNVSNEVTNITKNIGADAKGVVKYDADKSSASGFNLNRVTLGGTTYNKATGEGGTTITNVAKGVDDSDAVNVAQLNKVKSDLSDATKASATEVTVNGQTLTSTGVNNNGLVGKKTLGANNQAVYDITLSNNIALGSNTEDGSIVVNGADGKHSASLNGADGSLGLTNNGVSTKVGISSGDRLLNGTAANRLLYTEGTGAATETHELATLDDGLKFAGDDNTAVQRKLNSTVKISGGAATSNLTENNIGVVSNGSDGLKVQLAKDINLTKDGSVTTGDTVVNNNGVTVGTNTTLNANGLTAGSNKLTNTGLEIPTTGGTSVIINTNGINAGSQKITNVADGTVSASSKDAVNGSQLNKVQGDVNNVTNKVTNITKNIGADAKGVVKYDTDKSSASGFNLNRVTLGGTTYNKATGEGGTTITNVAKGVDDSDAVNVAQLNKVKNDLSDATKASATEVTVNGQTLTSTGVNNNGLVGKKTLGANNQAVYDITLSNKIALGSNTEDGSIVVNGADGKHSAFLNGANGSLGLTNNGVSTKVGISSGDRLLNGSAANRLLYTEGTGAATETHELATLDDGLKFAGDDNATVQRKLNSTVKISGGAAASNLTGNNIGVVSNGSDGLKVQLAKDINLTKDGSVTTGDTVVNNAGVTVGTNTTLNANGLTAGSNKLTNTGLEILTTGGTSVIINTNGINAGSQKITNVADGTVSDTSTDAVNGSQLNKVQGDVNNVSNEVTNITNKIGVDAKGVVKYDRNAAGDDFNLNQITLAGKDGTKITNVAAGDVSAASTDAINGSQLYKVQSDINKATKGSMTEVTVNGQTLTTTGTVNNNGLIGKKSVDETTGKATYDITLSDNVTLGSANNNGSIVVNSKDGKNSAALNGADGTLGLTNNDVTTKVGITSGAAVLDGTTANRLTYTDGIKTHQVATTDDGLTFAGDTGTAVQSKLNSKLNITGGETNSDNLADGNNVGVVANGTDGLKVQLAKNINLTKDGSVTTGDTVVNNSGVTVGTNTTLNANGLTAGSNKLTNTGLEIPTTGGTSVIINTNGINAGSQKITNVADGTVSASSKDAVNGSQLNKVQGDVNNVTNKITNITKNIGADAAGVVKYDRSGTTFDLTRVTFGGPSYDSSNHTGGTHLYNVAYASGSDGSEAVNVDYLNKRLEGVVTPDSSIGFTGDNAGVNADVKLNQRIQVTGGAAGKLTDGNIGVTVTAPDASGAGAKMDIKLAKDINLGADGSLTTGNTKVDNNGITVGTDTKLTKEGLEAGNNKLTKDGLTVGSVTIDNNGINAGDQKITHVADGTIGAGSKDAVNGGQLHDELSKIDTKISNSSTFKFDGDNKSTQELSLSKGDVFHVNGDSNHNIQTSAGANGLTVSMNTTLTNMQSITMGSFGGPTTVINVNNTTYSDGSGNSTTISSDGVRIAGGPSMTKDGVDAGGKKVTHVADGDISANSKDAINGGQLVSYVDAHGGMSEDVGREISKLGRGLAKLDNRLDRVGANAAALAALHPLTGFNPDEKWGFTAGVGRYRGDTAVAAGASYQPNEDVMVTIGGSTGGGENMVNAGVAFRFGPGHGANKPVANKQVTKKMENMQSEIDQLKNLVSTLVGSNVEIDTTVPFPETQQNQWAYDALQRIQPTGTTVQPMTRFEFAKAIDAAVQRGAKIDPRLLEEFKAELKYVRIQNVQDQANLADK